MLFLESDMCMTEVHIHSVFLCFFCLKYSNLSTSGGVEICSLCTQMYM